MLLWTMFILYSFFFSNILKTMWCTKMIALDNQSLWRETWPQNTSGSLFNTFHDWIILPYILKNICFINIISWVDELIWLKFMVQWFWCIFWWLFRCINMVAWVHESVWLDAWPQYKIDHCVLDFMFHRYCYLSRRLFNI